MQCHSKQTPRCTVLHRPRYPRYAVAVHSLCCCQSVGERVYAFGVRFEVALGDELMRCWWGGK